MKIDKITRQNLLELDRTIAELSVRKQAILSTLCNMSRLTGAVEIKGKYEEIVKKEVKENG